MSTKSTFIKLTALGFLASCTTACYESTNTTNSSSTSDEMVKCYGVAKKGKNACSNALGKHGCAGQARTDYDPCEWKVTKKSICDSKKGTTKPVNCKK